LSTKIVSNTKEEKRKGTKHKSGGRKTKKKKKRKKKNGIRIVWSLFLPPSFVTEIRAKKLFH
jgi:hypothetical protein